MTSSANPLNDRSTLYLELPPFADIRPEDFLPAFDEVEQKVAATLTRITKSPEPTTFENTLLPLEEVNLMLQRVLGPMYTWASSDTNDAIQQVEAELAPRMAALTDSLQLNAPLLARIKQIGELDDAEQAHIVARCVRDMTLAGADLDADAAQKVSAINARLAVAATEFDKLQLSETEDLAVVVKTAQELDGLDVEEIEAAAKEGRERGVDGYVIPLTYPTGHAYLAKLTHRPTREAIMRASLARCSRDNDGNTSALIQEVAQLRAQRAALLGFTSHAAWVTAGGTAKDVDSVLTMLAPIAKRAGANARKEQQRLAELAKADGVEDFASWDWDFYTEKLRRESLDVDLEALRPYFALENVLNDGVFYAANLLYGITFEPRADLIGWNDDTRVYEVHEENGDVLGLYLLDPYARATKRGGAWMHSLVDQNTQFGQKPVICNNLNVPKPVGDTPALLSFEEVTTFFHEFGYALHGLLSNVTYPSVSGTAVERDFVEFPSQVNELWALDPKILASYATHWKTGEALPAETAEKLRASGAFNQGFLTSEYISAALLDFEIHMLGKDEAAPDLEEFTTQVRRKYGIDNDVVPSRYYLNYFQHIFSGAYSAGYYGYIWSEVLDADACGWFEENGGATRQNGQHFRATLLGVGGSMDSMAAYEKFRGRAARTEPLLERRGLV